MTNHLLERFCARRRHVLSRWMDLMRRTHNAQFLQSHGRVAMETLWERVLRELEHPDNADPPSFGRYESVCDLGALYATGAQALREELVIAGEAVDIRELAIAAEQLSHAFARAVLLTRSEQAASSPRLVFPHPMPSVRSSEPLELTASAI